MSRRFKANEVRTRLLLKISSEITNYTNSKMLINTILPLNIYNSYDIEINLTKSTEFSITKIKENQKKFYDDTSLKKELEITYMDVFRKINKIILF